MPAKDRKKRSEAWYRWYEKNRAKHHASVRKHEKKRRAEFRSRFDQYKVDKGCKYCGFDAHPAALDFDHRPGEKKLFDISTMITRGHGELAILAEIAKCDVVCANCHRIVTVARRTVPGSSGLGRQPVTLEGRVQLPVAPPL